MYKNAYELKKAVLARKAVEEAARKAAEKEKENKKEEIKLEEKTEKKPAKRIKRENTKEFLVEEKEQPIFEVKEEKEEE